MFRHVHLFVYINVWQSTEFWRPSSALFWGCQPQQDYGFKLDRVRDWPGHGSVSQTERAYAFLRTEDPHAAIDAGPKTDTARADSWPVKWRKSLRRLVAGERFGHCHPTAPVIRVE